MATWCLVTESVRWTYSNVLLFLWRAIPRILLNILLGFLACMGLLAIVLVFFHTYVYIFGIVEPEIAIAAAAASQPLTKFLTTIGTLLAADYLSFCIYLIIAHVSLDLSTAQPSPWIYVTWGKTIGIVAIFSILQLLLLAIPGTIINTPASWYSIPAIGGFALFALACFVVVRTQCALFIVLERGTRLWGALRESWNITRQAQGIFIGTAILIGLIILSMLEKIVSFIPRQMQLLAGISLPREPFSVITLLYILASYILTLFFVALYRRLTQSTNPTKR
jgi:hypothetical protein